MEVPLSGLFRVGVYSADAGASGTARRSATARACPREGRIPTAAPDRAADVASHRLKHHLKRHPVADWVHQQAYLHPYPKELMLRNHAWHEPFGFREQKDQQQPSTVYFAVPGEVRGQRCNLDKTTQLLYIGLRCCMPLPKEPSCLRGYPNACLNYTGGCRPAHCSPFNANGRMASYSLEAGRRADIRFAFAIE
jgi:hypothetical protein